MDVQSLLQKLIDTYTNVANVGDTPQNKGQCVGLIECWLDLTGYPHIWGNAIDLLNNADANFYEIVLNTPLNYPSPGDIVIFGAPYGQYVDNNGQIKYAGHTGVVLNADVHKMTLLEQNDPLGTTPHQQDYGYTNCIGWIHFKDVSQTNVTSPSTIADIDTHGLDLNNKQSLQEALDTWWLVASNQYKPIADYQKLEIQNTTLSEQLQKQIIIDNVTKTQLDTFHAMQALGYNTVDDITKALSTKDAVILSLQTENAQVRNRNSILAGEIQKMETESNKAAELGQKSLEDNQNFTDGFRKLIEIIEVKDRPSWSKIFDQVLFYKDMYNKFMTHLDAEQQKSVTQTIREVVTSPTMKKVTGTDFLVQLFGMIPSKKEVK